MMYTRKRKNKENRRSGNLRGVIYTRVSSQEQLNGYSPEAQLEKLTEYCESKNIEVVAHFHDTFTGKTFDRPEFNKLVKLLEENRGEIDLLLVVRYNRFGRSMEESFRNIWRLRKLGVEVVSLEEPVDSDSTESILLRSIYLSIPEI